MATTLFLVLIVKAVGVALRRWRAGIGWAIVVGMLQDPVRKLTPETPPILAIASLPVWAAILVKLRVTEADTWARFRRAWPRIARRMGIFVLLLFPAAVMAFQYGFEAWRLVVLGVMGYVAPLLGIMMGFAYVDRPEQLRSFLTFYCLLTSLMMVGTLLQYGGLFPGWAVIGTDALGMMWLRYPDEGVFEMMSGFYRSPDIMGWHAATLTMLALTLAVADPGPRGARWLAPAVLGAVCLLVSGRRKMIVMPAIWIVVAAIAYVRAGRTSRLAPMVAITALVVAGFSVLSTELEVTGDYFAYAGTVQNASGGRVWSAWDDLGYTLAQSGVLGEGLGAASQGAQHIVIDRRRSWQESGLSKLLVELGVLGFLARVPEGALLTGLIGVCIANGASFVVSHQVYGDLLAMTLTAFLVGVALAGRRWLDAAAR
jgi:hypothetical protein